jgi:hypothetical protein
MPRGRPRKAVEPKVNLTEHQIDSIRNAIRAIDSICDYYQSLCHPHIDDIIKLDDAKHGLKWAFSKVEELKND